MDDLDFFVDLLITGTVLGLDDTSSLAEVERVYADSTFDAPSGQITDGGLVEFGWWKGRVTYFGAQAHRLKSGVEPTDPLVARYGPFRPLLNVDDLLAAARARGFTPVAVPRRGLANAGYGDYREPSTGMNVLYLADPDEAGEPGPAGLVVKMLGTGERTGRVTRFDGDRRTFGSAVKRLPGLTDAEVVAWVDRNEPDSDRADWWHCLRHVASWRYGIPADEVPRWWRLRTTLDRLAEERGIDSEPEMALVLASTRAEGHELGEPDVPPVQDAVARWLAAMSDGFTEARDLAGRDLVDADDIRRARALRNRIHEISAFAPLLTSAGVADELRAWTDLRPLLLVERSS